MRSLWFVFMLTIAAFVAAVMLDEAGITRSYEVFWVITFGPAVLYGVFRLGWHFGYRARDMMTCCRECGYDLRGCTEPGCPECGWGRPAS